MESPALDLKGLHQRFPTPPYRELLFGACPSGGHSSLRRGLDLSPRGSPEGVGLWQRLQLPGKAFWTWGQVPFYSLIWPGPHTCSGMRVPGRPGLLRDCGVWGEGGHCWPVQRGDLVAEEPSVLIAVHGPSLRPLLHWPPGNLGGRAQRGLAGNPAPGGKEAGSPGRATPELLQSQI